MLHHHAAYVSVLLYTRRPIALNVERLAVRVARLADEDQMPSVASAPTGWTIRVGFVTLALFAFAYGVCYGATIAPRPAVIADHFAGPDLAAVTGLHYTSSVLGPPVGPAAFGYSVDFWNGDLIASCVAAACLIAAGYFFAAKPPQVRPRRAGICRPQPRRAKMRGFIGFRPLALPAT